jgi:uncharacterized integral membrane protein
MRLPKAATALGDFGDNAGTGVGATVEQPSGCNLRPRPVATGRRVKEASLMRWVYLAVICVFAAAVIIFVVQNVQIVTMSFLGFSARVPLALLAAGIYLLGAVTGGSLLALLRQSIEGAKKRPAGAP